MSANPEPVNIQRFTQTQLYLLDLELQSEISETTSLITSGSSPTALQRAGVALTNLTLASQRTGLGGKLVVELVLDSAVRGGREGEFPEHAVRVGDIVAVAEQPAGSAKKREIKDLEAKGTRGVVTKVQKSAVFVALDREDEEVGLGRLWIVKLANDITYKRMNQAMVKIQKMQANEYSNLIRVLFGLASPNFDAPSSVADLEWIDQSLNNSQKQAIRFALASREVALIHGPPGTGKTHTLIELILQMLKLRLRVLVCGPSNISVDNIVERLSPHKVPILRLGHPARLLPSVLNHSLDVLTRNSDSAQIVQDVRKEMDDRMATLKKTRNRKEKNIIYDDIKILRKEFRQREEACVTNLVEGSKVVLATLHGAGGFQLKREDFDVVIVDEASQALEAQCWVPLIRGKKVVLAGDHLQLPPTIKSLNSKAKPKGKDSIEDIDPNMTLETTLFDRLLSMYGSSIKRMLTTQYRMHENIMKFPSTELYDGELVAADAVKARLLNTLPYEVVETEDTMEPLVFWDTQGGDFPENSEEEDIGKKPGRGLMSESKSNPMEAALVRLQVRKLVDAGLKAEDIGVLSPYNAQLSLMSYPLKEEFPGIELGSIDGFQGREKEAIIVSLVRSNSDREVGFLSEKRRLNVAMTRPRRFLAVIGDSSTISHGSDFLKRWMAYLEENSDLRYPDIMELNQ